MNEQLIKALEAVTACRRDVPASTLTTFKIGGRCDLVLAPQSEDELTRALRLLSEAEEQFLVLGKGSNVVFSDEGYRGAIVLTGGLSEINVSGEVMTAGVGASITRCAAVAQKHALAGLAFAYGIPGSLGGAVYMNAGAYGGEMSNVIVESRYLDLSDCSVHTLSAAEHDFGYRHSNYRAHSEWVILSAQMRLETGDAGAIRTEMEDYMARRTEKQPLEYPSAGSVFKRYPGFFTAQLIDEAGLKGTRVGGAQVSEKHAGFIINRGGATCEDVRRLIDKIKETIYERNGIHIECEIIFI